MKKIPMRKCCGCLEMKSKKELIRVVKLDEEYFVDKTGKSNGRGAYICENVECFEKAYKNKGFERSFKSAIPKEIYENLKGYFYS
ncbi:MAG: RNase P modulator RnpM [Lachnospirales bacterium]